jgi:hypothetical protein
MVKNISEEYIASVLQSDHEDSMFLRNVYNYIRHGIVNSEGQKQYLNSCENVASYLNNIRLIPQRKRTGYTL